MTIKLGVVMDPIATIKPYKDSTLAMLLEAQARDWQLFYIEPADLFQRRNRCFARMQSVQVKDDSQHWYRLENAVDQGLDFLDVVLMRKDPPFDMEYIYATYLLELAEQQDCLVVNSPQSLRNANEKLFTSQFPQHMPETLVSKDMARLRAFIQELGDCILKPLDGMGGTSIFRVTASDANLAVILETLTDHGKLFCMAQAFIPEISQGDKRILMIDGKPIDYALARIPAQGETRGNLAAGGTGLGQPLTESDYRIARDVGPVLQQQGILFAGLDVIGDKLTEINVTSPTCIRELDAQFNLNIAGTLMDTIETRLGKG